MTTAEREESSKFVNDVPFEERYGSRREHAWDMNVAYFPDIESDKLHQSQNFISTSFCNYLSTS